MVLYYFAIKLVFFFGLVRAYVRYEPLQRHFLFLALLYTAGAALLSLVFAYSWRPIIPWRRWELELAARLVLSVLYFRLLARFDEGLLFGLLLLAGVVFVVIV